MPISFEMRFIFAGGRLCWKIRADVEDVESFRGHGRRHADQPCSGNGARNGLQLVHGDELGERRISIGVHDPEFVPPIAG